MAEQVLKFTIRTDGAQARAEAEATARAITSAVRGAVSAASGALSGASGGSIQGDVRSVLQAARLEQAQQRVAISAQNVAAAQTRAEAATIRATTSYNRATESAQKFATGQRTLEQTLGRVGGSLRNLGLGLTSLGSSLSISLTAPLAALAAFASSGAKNIDAVRNRLLAFEGSLDAANARLLRNLDLARKSVGVTNELANESFALFKGLRGITDETIEKTIAGIGRLNAVYSIPDLTKFQQNLGQIFNLGFNTKDIREASRPVPIFNQLLESAFGTSDPAQLRKLKASGKLTLDTFLSGLADAINSDPKLSQVREAIGTRLAKTFERIQISLAPLGDAILKLVEGLVSSLEPAISTLARGFASLPVPIQTVIVLLGTLTAGIGPALFVMGQMATGIGGLISAFGRLNAAGLLPTIQGFRNLAIVMKGGETATLTGSAATAVAVAGWAALAAAIAAAVVASLAITRAVHGYLESLREAHPWVVKFGESVILAVNPLYGLLNALGLIGPETKKVATAQQGAIGPVTDFTEAIDEESESLKSLRRALDEVELATKARTAAAQRAYNEDAASLASTTAQRIKALKEQRTAELARIDQVIAERRAMVEAQSGGQSGLGPHGAVSKELKKAQDELEQAKLERKKVVTETETEIENIRSEFRVRERQNQEQHSAQTLASQREDAEARIDALRAAAERDESLRRASEQKVAEIEREQTNLEIKEIRRRIDATAEGTEARARLEDELGLRLAQSRRREAEARRRDEAAERSELESHMRALLTRREAGLAAYEAMDTAHLAALRAVGQLRLRSAVDTENSIIEVERRGFERRIKALQEDVRRAGQIFDKQKKEEAVAAAEAALLREQNARGVFESGIPFRTADAAREDNQRLREANAERNRIQRDALSEAIEVGRLDIDAMRRHHASRKEIAIAERDLDLDEAKNRRAAQRDALRDELETELERIKGLSDYLERKKELEDLYRERDLLSEEEYQRRKKEIEDRYKQGTSADPFQSIKDAWTDFKNHVKDAEDSIRESVAHVAETTLAAFNSMEDALRQGIASWILYGDSLGKALKTALAQSLASVAADAAIQALKHAAYAIGSLAFGDAKGAILHAKAAAAFTALAVAAGVAARGLANSAGLTQKGGQAGSVAAADTQPRNQQFNYGSNFSTPASEDAGGGSRYQGKPGPGAAIAGALNQLNSQISRLQSMPAGHVVTMGAADAHEAIGVAVIRQSGANDGFNDALARNMRVA